jgi:hypothetical protein
MYIFLKILKAIGFSCALAGMIWVVLLPLLGFIGLIMYFLGFHDSLDLLFTILTYFSIFIGVVVFPGLLSDDNKVRKHFIRKKQSYVAIFVILAIFSIKKSMMGRINIW